MTTLFIGGGNMATALIGGMLARGRAPRDFRVVEPHPPQREKLAARFAGIDVQEAVGAGVLDDVDLVVLAVKPQQMRDVARSLASVLPRTGGPVILTIAAGIRLADLARWLSGAPRLVRAMPNTPALIGKGISGAYAGPEIDAAERALAASVLEAAGELIWVAAEPMLDAVTAVSGSGPAYVFYFLEACEEAARDLGLAPDDARRLAYATFAGAVALAQASDLPPATLRAQVTSKGGTTERALAMMDTDAVKAKIIAAVKSAADRAQELGAALGAAD